LEIRQTCGFPLSHSHDGFLAGLINHRELHAAVLNVHDGFGGIAPREDGFFSSKCIYFSAQTGRVEKQFHIENRDCRIRFFGGAAGFIGYTAVDPKVKTIFLLQ
jgi:hypothetical protein